MTLDCPWCGPRVAAEFQYRGEIVARPRPDDTNQAEWRSYLFMRSNQTGVNRERWYHTHGCRRFLTVERDLATNTVIGVAKA
jgi:sarcosine oxidase, subunit delta